MKFVFDTNLLISAALKDKSKPAYALFLAIKNGKLIFSKESEKELFNSIY